MTRAATLLAVVALAACGTNLDRHDFVLRADALCAEAILLSKPVLEDLKEIVPPRELASPYGKFLDEAKRKDWLEAANAARESGLERCAALAEAGQ